MSEPTNATVLRERPVRAGTLLSGVDTLARLLVLRNELDERDGLTTATLVSGYPGSPLGTFDLTLDRLGDTLGAHRVVHRPGLNEELAAAAVWGSQMGGASQLTAVDGVVGAWYGKTPGLDRCGDVLKHANAMGTGPHGGAVAFCGDDPAAKSSTLPCDSQYTFADACLPVLYPGNQQEVLDLGVHAFRMSRYSGSWVGLKVVTAVADGIGTVDLAPGRHTPTDPRAVVAAGGAGQPWHHEPRVAVGPHAVPGQEQLVAHDRLLAAQAYARHNQLDRVVGAEPGARLGVVCAGKTYYDVVQAFADLGVGLDELADVGVRVLKLAMPYPLVEQTAVEFAGTADEIVVIEEKRPFVETQLRSILHEARVTTPVVGKRDRDRQVLSPSAGELDAGAVAAVLTRMLPALASARKPASSRLGTSLLGTSLLGTSLLGTSLPLVDLPSRSPGFCSGCPHNRSTVFPEGALVGGGVGCHGIMYFEARHQGMKSLPPTPMGSEGAPWIGLSPFVDDPHLIQNLGDGTLSHSGILAIRASVAAGTNITFKILYNTAVAMTGGQDVVGLMDVPAMTRALEAEGVRQVVVCAEDPKRYGRKARWAPGVRVLGRDRLDEVQEELRGVAGVSVIVYDQRCAAEARRLRKRGELKTPPRRVVINEAVCEGCGDCGTKSNCLSVLPHQTEFGEKRQIDDLSCNRDYTCLDGDCPSFVTVAPARPRWWRRSRPAVGSAKAGGGKAGSGRAGGARADRIRPSLPDGDLPAPVAAAVEEQFGIYFTGVGGTGVVTANRILAAAAEAAGFAVGGMDQTGLSQKAGAVVSHLHLAADGAALGSATVSAGGADLYLSGDILQAAGAKHLVTVNPGRTIAVVATDVAPTAAMLQSDVAVPDGAALRRAITDHLGADRVVFVDSKRIAEEVFANQLLANVVLLGAAFQRGGLPMSVADVEAAVRRQGKSAAENLAAFTWGRWAAHDAAAVESQLAAAGHDDASDGGTSGARGSITDPSPCALATAVPLVAGRTVPAELRDLLVRRAAQVADYQNAARANRFLDLVERVASHDDAGHGWALTRAVAESWFKLLTYKDEYEVARLHLLVDYDEVAADLGIEWPYAVTYHLHPPTLRRLGRTKKVPMGKPYAIAFRGLRAMKRLRGTPFDVFGWDPDRRTERAVVEEYERLVDDLVAAPAGAGVGSPAGSGEPARPGQLPYESLVRLAASAMTVKGYGPIKEDSVVRWRQEVAELRRQPVST